MEREKMFAEVLLPLRLRCCFTYRVPDEMLGTISQGSWVNVALKGKESLGIVLSLQERAPEDVKEEWIRPLLGIVDKPAVSEIEIGFWQNMADYYMCTLGEVFKAAYNVQLQRAVSRIPRRVVKKADDGVDADYSAASELSPLQQDALSSILKEFGKNRAALLEGVTGSGKTEIYIHLAIKELQRGRSVLYLVPEIAISKQLEQRLRKVFGGELLVFHSKQTIPQRKAVMEMVQRGAKIVLGTRSAVLLPFCSLGLVIIDEEHDQSYKQSEPAPRYNGRDAALMLASGRGANVLLGSATPSFETIYNVECGKYGIVHLSEKYYSAAAPQVKIIDTNEAWRHREMVGSFSRELINEMRVTLSRGEQILVFRSRRAYATMVQCSECGDIPKCPRCNVSLSYHRFNNTLKCHYCGYSYSFTTRCKACEEPSLIERGAGTEKVEEELNDLFPDCKVARFDADTTASKKQEEGIIKDFAAGKIDILVGTQMITKGFDFKNLSMVVLLSADSLFAVQDFRSDERAVQLMTQLLGRAGRHGNSGRLLIQTAQKEHPALRMGAASQHLLEERKQFGYPPFVRLVTVTVKDRYEDRLIRVCGRLREEFSTVKGCEIVGPVAPALDYIDKEHLMEFHIKLPRNSRLGGIKKALSEKIGLVESEFNRVATIVVDVDPQ